MGLRGALKETTSKNLKQGISEVLEVEMILTAAEIR